MSQPPAQLFLSRGKCHLALDKPKLALSDANTAIKLDEELIAAKIVKAEALYSLLMFEKSLVIFTKLLKVKPGLKKAKLGIIKCSKAIENSITRDCFDVNNIEDIFRCALKDVQSAPKEIGTDFETSGLWSRKLEGQENENAESETSPTPKQKKVQVAITKNVPTSKKEVHDFLGALNKDANYIKSLTKTKQLQNNATLRNAVDFIDKRTHFWKNEDPSKGRKCRTTSFPLERRKSICSSRLANWEDILWKTQRENESMSRQASANPRTRTR